MMNMMRRIFYFLSFILPLAVIGQTNVIDEVLWIVGDEAILRSDVEQQRISMQMEGEVIKGDPDCVIPEMIAVQKLYLHQAKLDSIEVSDAQVAQSVEQWLNYVVGQIGSREKVEEYFKKSLPTIRSERTEIVRDQQIVSQMKQKLVEDVKVTPSEVRNHFTRITPDSLPYVPTSVEVEIITIQPEQNVSETEAIKVRLREFTDQATSGKMEFSTLARLYSDDKESAKRGGELGFMGKGQLVPEFASAAFNLNEPGRISKVVESEYGFHIIQLIEKRGDRVNCRHILLKPQVGEKELEDARLRLDSVRTAIVGGESKFDVMALHVSSDKDTRNNKGLMVNQRAESAAGGSSRFQMQDLPPEISRKISTMNVGDISDVFTMISSKQKEVVAIVRLKSKIEGHRANLSDDFQTLKAIVEEKKREETLRKWILEKQSNTYIRVPESATNCQFEYPGWIRKK